MSDTRTAPSRFNISASLADWIFDIVMPSGLGGPSGSPALRFSGSLAQRGIGEPEIR